MLGVTMFGLIGMTISLIGLIALHILEARAERKEDYDS